MSSFADFQTALDAVGVSVRRGMGIAPFDEVLNAVRDKWAVMDQTQKQALADAFIRYMVE